ncbi:MAG: hypothetical protein AAF718_13390 [Pseudomonadota bacterium]
MKQKFTSRFFKNEKGSLSVEACFAVPLLAWAITATFVFFDAFRTLNVSQKATYTIADMISREDTRPIDDNYIDALYETYTYLAGQSGHPSALRITTVVMDVDPVTGDPILTLEESRGVKYDPMNNIDDIRARLPDIAPGDQMIIVESVQQWLPAFFVGLTAYNFREVALARPRFAPRVCWDTLNGCTVNPPTPSSASTDDGNA